MLPLPSVIICVNSYSLTQSINQYKFSVVIKINWVKKKKEKNKSDDWRRHKIETTDKNQKNCWKLCCQNPKRASKHWQTIDEIANHKQPWITDLKTSPRLKKRQIQTQNFKPTLISILNKLKLSSKFGNAGVLSPWLDDHFYQVTWQLLVLFSANEAKF